MRIRKIHAQAIVVVGAIVTVLAGTACASAEPQRLDCLLTDTEARPGSERRSIIVTFDEGDKTMTAEDGDRRYTFTKVSITNVAMSGHADNISLGIDRSSLGIVWQQYGPDRVRSEYGRCRTGHAP
jgi:hypothetical protein